MSAPDNPHSATPSAATDWLSGVAGGLLLGLAESISTAPTVAAQFSWARQRWWFVLLLLCICVGTISLISALRTVLTIAIGRLSARLSRSSSKQQLWQSGLWCAIFAAPLAWLCTQVFSGPKAQLIPGHQAIAVVLWALSLLTLQRIQLLLPEAKRWLQSGPRLIQLGTALLLLGLSVVLFVADRRVLPRLYPWFHQSLQGLLIANLLLITYLGPVVRQRRLSQLLLLALVLCVSGWGLMRLQRAQVLRSLAQEHTGIVAQVLRGYASIKSGTTRMQPPAAPAASPEDPQETPPAWTGARLGERDVFLITVDALRFDRLNPQTMPFVSSLAQRGVLFTRAYTQVPHTSFAVATLLTGKPVYALLTMGQDAASHETLPTVLRRFRYKTAAFYPPSVFFVEHERLKKLEETAYGFEYVKVEYLPAARRTAQVEAFLKDEKPQRVFAWIHYLEPHEPYETHPGGPGKERSDRERYDGEVRFIDDEIRQLVELLRKTRPGALLVLAADHGEEFGEHGGRYHGTSLYEEQVHVPLLIVDTAEVPQLPARAYPQPVGLLDVAPTLLGLLDIEPSVRMRGLDLSAWLLSGAQSLPKRAIFSEIGRKKMIVRGEHKLLCDLATDSCQAYNLALDPQERRNVLETEAATASDLRGRLDRFLAEARQFEQQPAPSTSDAAQPTWTATHAAAMSRARMGDRTVLPSLLPLLENPMLTAQQQNEVLALSAQLTTAAVPDLSDATDPLKSEPALFSASTQASLRRHFARLKAEQPAQQEALRWTAILRTRLQDADSTVLSLVSELLQDDQAPAPQRLAAALALTVIPSCQPSAMAKNASLDCSALWQQALPAAMTLDDPERVRPLLLALSSTRDKRALPVLLEQLSAVRSRPDVVAALGQLGAPGATVPLIQLLNTDPYVPVRAAAAKALGQLGGAQAQAALTSALTHERESQVIGAVQAARSAKPER